MFKLINHVKVSTLKLNIQSEEKIHRLLNSDAVNYLETSERLILKNILENESISQLETENLDRIFIKYEKFLKN